MRTLVINPGSSSLKLSIVDNESVVDNRTLRGWNGLPAPWPVEDLCVDSGPVEAIGVRIVHGGNRAEPLLLDHHELRALEEYVPLAQLHQTRSLAMAQMAMTLFDGIPVVGCFDTSFHTGLPQHTVTYPVPREWTSRYRLRRYGFHGLSCAYALRRAGRLLGSDPDQLNLICCHIGSEVSVTAIAGGRSVDTSMGLTPLDGAVMATRPGSLDPGLLLHVLRTSQIPLADAESALTHQSGLAGMSGTSGDMWQVLAARAEGSEDADLALRVYMHRLRREIAAARTSLDRLDAVVLTGGVAEHEPGVRADVVNGLEHLGLAVDAQRNHGTGDRVISPDSAKTRLLVVEAREDLEISRQVKRALQSQSPPAGQPDSEAFRRHLALEYGHVHSRWAH